MLSARANNSNSWGNNLIVYLNLEILFINNQINKYYERRLLENSLKDKEYGNKLMKKIEESIEHCMKELYYNYEEVTRRTSELAKGLAYANGEWVFDPVSRCVKPDFDSVKPWMIFKASASALASSFRFFIVKNSFNCSLC